MIKSLIPRVELPNYFRIISAPNEDKTKISVIINPKDPKEISTEVPSCPPTLLDVVKAFPTLDLSRVNAFILGALGVVTLPVSWVLECQKAETKEGFKLTFDVGARHWEKEFEVTTMQLAELVDLIEWVKEANKISNR